MEKPRQKHAVAELIKIERFMVSCLFPLCCWLGQATALDCRCMMVGKTDLVSSET
jgi:hypothetical protein